MANLKTISKAAMAMTMAAGLAACGGGQSHSGKVGPAGGTVTAAGVKVSFPAGALSQETQIEVTDLARDDHGHKIHVGPDDVKLDKSVSITMTSDDGNAADDKMVEIHKSAGGGEVEVEVENESEHEVEAEHGREMEVEHLGEFELRPMKACVPACDSGLQCDDGVCKPHGGA
jgi:hypothetical protein